jgi:hypothetical protein
VKKIAQQEKEKRKLTAQHFGPGPNGRVIVRLK